MRVLVMGERLRNCSPRSMVRGEEGRGRGEEEEGEREGEEEGREGGRN